MGIVFLNLITNVDIPKRKYVMKETKQKKSRMALAIHIMLLIISLIIPAVAAENEEKYSILIIAHESWGENWCAPVRDVVADVYMPYPVEFGFLGFVLNETDNDAVERLDNAGVTKIISVPHFVSSHSSHIQGIEYVLGLIETLPMTSNFIIVEGVQMERSVLRREMDT